MAKKKYYVVKKGKTPGIYFTWDDCKAQVDGVSGAIYKSFTSMEEAMAWAGDINGASARDSSSAFDKQSDSNSNSGEVSLSEKIYSTSEKFVAYVDGSFNVANGKAALGVVLFADGEEIHISKEIDAKDLVSMRNVAGEIMAAKEAMAFAVSKGAKELTIYHDYQGISSWCLGEWKTNLVGTTEYKEYYLSIKDKLKVDFVKVKGHSGDKYNDLADELAKAAIF